VSASKMLYEVANEFLKLYECKRSENVNRVVALIENKVDKNGNVWICNKKVYKRKPKTNPEKCLYVPKDEAIKILLRESVSVGEKIWTAVKEWGIAIPINTYSILAETAYFDGGYIVHVGEWLNFIFTKPEAKEKYWREAERICHIAECIADKNSMILYARFR